MSSLTLIWLVTLILPLGLGLWAQRKVKSTFERYSQVPVRNGMTGAQAAAAVIRSSGLQGVEIRAVEGRLTDHYDPRNRTLNLMRVRQTFVPVASIGSSLAIPVIFIGLLVGATGLTNVGLALFTAIVLFQLVTLPVEFDASRRALVALRDGRLLEADELDGAKRVLSAAAWTYVAAFVAALSQLIYFFVASRR
jgi:Zn-dependent membrane protease YugP